MTPEKIFGLLLIAVGGYFMYSDYKDPAITNKTSPYVKDGMFIGLGIGFLTGDIRGA